MRSFLPAATICLAIAGVSLTACDPIDVPASPAPSASQTATPNAEQRFSVQLGQKVTYPDGTAVTVASLGVFKPSDSTFISVPAARYVLLQVTLTNGSGKAFDADSTLVNATVNGAEVESLYDSSQGVMGTPSISVQPGKSVTFKVALGAPAAKADLQVDVQPNFLVNRQAAVFTGNV